jgi:glycosyltransferase involved in cell wall biosynthesis
VISCPVAGIPELVRNGETGILVPPDNSQMLAEAIIRLGCDDSLRIRLGKQARLLAEQQHNQRMNTSQFLGLLINGDVIPR